MIPEKLHTDWIRVRSREDINDAATDAEFTWNFNDRHASVSQAKEVGDQRLPFEGRRRLEVKDRLLECRARNHTMHGGGDGSDEDGGRVDEQAMKGHHPVCNQPDMRRRRFIGKRFPFREPGEVLDRTTHESIEEAQVIEHSFGGLVARGHHDPWAAAME